MVTTSRNHVSFKETAALSQISFKEYKHLPIISQDIINDSKRKIAISTVLRRIGMKNALTQCRALIQRGYREVLWPFLDAEGKYCFATSHYAGSGAESVELLNWLAENANPTQFTLERYTVGEEIFKDQKLWPRMNGGNVHRDQIYIVRSE